MSAVDRRRFEPTLDEIIQAIEVAKGSTGLGLRLLHAERARTQLEAFTTALRTADHALCKVERALECAAKQRCLFGDEEPALRDETPARSETAPSIKSIRVAVSVAASCGKSLRVRTMHAAHARAQLMLLVANVESAKLRLTGTEADLARAKVQGSFWGDE